MPPHHDQLRQSALRFYSAAVPLATAPLSEAGDTDAWMGNKGRSKWQGRLMALVLVPLDLREFWGVTFQAAITYPAKREKENVSSQKGTCFIKST